MRTKFWLLCRLDCCGYDETDSFVVRSATSPDARQLAAKMATDEGGHVWLDELLSSCKRLEEEGPEDVIISSFNAG